MASFFNIWWKFRHIIFHEKMNTLKHNSNEVKKISEVNKKMVQNSNNKSKLYGTLI